jgi:hypothetical protein
LNPSAVNDVRLTPRALTLAGDTGSHRAYFTPMSGAICEHLHRVWEDIAASLPSPEPV